MQKRVFQGALVRVLSALPEHPEHLDELSKFFRDLNYANLGATCLGPSEVLQQLSIFCGPVGFQNKTSQTRALTAA